MQDSSSNAAVGGGYGSSSLSQAAQDAAYYADLFTLKCEAGFFVLGLREGEAVCTPIRVVATLVTMSVASAWFSRRKSIKMLLLFFSHWLSGLVHLLTFLAESTMISVCWAGENLENLIRLFKFVELSASNMLAITNLAMCVNLSFIVMSHRTLSRVKSLSSPGLMWLFLAISMGIAATSAPFWEFIVLSGTGFWVSNEDKGAQDWVPISMFFVEFFVGVCMLLIVTWLLLFWMKEIKGCWKINTRIRYYFGLTLISTAVNLALGVCGTIHVINNRNEELLLVCSWAFRYIHVALDTVVLYGVLGTGNMDERATSTAGAAISHDTESGEARAPADKCSLCHRCSRRAASSRRGSTNRSSSSSSGSSKIRPANAVAQEWD